MFRANSPGLRWKTFGAIFSLPRSDAGDSILRRRWGPWRKVRHTSVSRYRWRRISPRSVLRRQKRPGWFPGKGFFTTPRLSWQWGFAVAAIAFLIAGSWLLTENMRLRQQISQSQAQPEGPGTREQELEKELERQRQAVAKTEQELTRVRDERERLAAELKQQAPESQVASGERNAPNQQRPSPRGISIASFILTPQMRGVQQIPTISIPADTDRVSMQLELEPNDFSAYRVVLIDQAGPKPSGAAVNSERKRQPAVKL